MKNNIITPKYNYNGTFLRQNRSFVCRKGRITTSQLSAIQKYWCLIGVNFQLKPINLSSIFNRHAPVVLEIGFGSGQSLVKSAIGFPDKNFIGIEVYKSGIGSCLNSVYAYGIKNLRVIYYDAVEVMQKMILDHTISTIQIFFPDPWNKKRHHKRRLLKNNFLKIIANKLTLNGILHIATDSKSYALYILDEIKDIENYKNLSTKNNFIKRPSSRIMTKFEKKGCLKGNKIFDLMFQLKK